MPTVFGWKGYRFFFFSNEGTPLEEVHIHVKKGERSAKFWLNPSVSLANSYKFSAIELNQLEKLVDKNRTLILGTWNEYFKI